MGASAQEQALPRFPGQLRLQVNTGDGQGLALPAGHSLRIAGKELPRLQGKDRRGYSLSHPTAMTKRRVAGAQLRGARPALEALGDPGTTKGVSAGTATASTGGPGSSVLLCSHSVWSLRGTRCVGSVRTEDVSPPPPDLSLSSSHPGGIDLTRNLSERLQMNKGVRAAGVPAPARCWRLAREPPGTSIFQGAIRTSVHSCCGCHPGQGQ